MKNAIAGILLLLFATGAVAQSNYPEKPVRILVGFTPGVAPDIAARLLARAGRITVWRGRPGWVSRWQPIQDRPQRA